MNVLIFVELWFYATEWENILINTIDLNSSSLRKEKQQ